MVGLLLAGALAGCGQGLGMGPRAAIPSEDSSRAPVRPTPTAGPSTVRVGPRPGEQAETGTWPPTCEGASTGQRLAWSPVDAGLGHRYLTLAVRNCGPGTLTLPERPTPMARDAVGRALALRMDWQKATRSLDLARGEVAYLSLHWLSNGHCEQGAASLRTTVVGETVTATGCLQLGDFETEEASSDISSTIRVGWTASPQQ